MSRKKRHEEHVNHEGWAIPYGDLITLLLAFFVVMYSISSVNEGKYRVLSESLSAAFRGPPKSAQPIQMGERSPVGSGRQGHLDIMPRARLEEEGFSGWPADTVRQDLPDLGVAEAMDAWARELSSGLQVMAEEVRDALGEFIELEQVRLRQTPFWIEIEVTTDILFETGQSRISDQAVDTLRRLAEVLLPFPNPLRVEGHTDSVPIETAQFPSNWELSAARAASVVRLFQNAGIPPERLAAIGMGEYRPVADNDSVEGRTRNRRVLVVVLAGGADGYEFQQSTVGARSQAPLPFRIKSAGSESQLIGAAP